MRLHPAVGTVSGTVFAAGVTAAVASRSVPDWLGGTETDVVSKDSGPDDRDSGGDIWPNGILHGAAPWLGA